MINYPKNILVISAPSGTGKTTITERLLKTCPNIQRGITHTTRSLRNEEQNGKDYYFVSRPEFSQMIRKNKFLEWAEVYGNYYGTSIEEVKSILEAGKICLLLLDTQGKSKVSLIRPDIVSVFLAPPSKEELANRLKNRAIETGEEQYILNRRLSNFQQEMAHAGSYDFQVVNQNIDETVAKIADIIDDMRKTHFAN